MRSRGGVLQTWLLLALLPTACAPPVERPSLSAARHGAGIFHIVKPGENLFRIGQGYGISSAELARVNGIRDMKQIRVGQKLFIPGATRQMAAETIPSEGTSAEPTRRSPGAEIAAVFLWPVTGSVNSGFGPRGSSFHDGLDIAAPEGTPIRAIEHGEVIYSEWLRGYGNTVIIRHGGGIVSVYAHNQTNLVRDGQQVARGEIIGRVGSTGRVTGPHLHFEIRKDNLAQDPMLYLPELCCVSPSDMVSPEG